MTPEARTCKRELTRREAGAHTRRRPFAGLLRRIGAAVVAVLIGLPGALAADPEDGNAIEFGILPTLSARTTLSTYEPLRAYLEATLHRPVRLVTAPDLATYLERTRRGAYSFLVTAPHFARLAQSESGYVAMVRITQELRGLIVVRDDSDIRTLQGLRGKTISTPERLAVVTMLGLELLRRQGLVPGRDFVVRPAASFSSAILALQNGESDAAIASPTALRQMREESRVGLRILASTAPVPGTVYLAHPRVAPADTERMTQALIGFSSDRRHGAEFFAHTGYGGLTRATPNELRSLDPYVAELKHLLAASGGRDSQ